MQKARAAAGPHRRLGRVHRPQRGQPLTPTLRELVGSALLLAAALLLWLVGFRIAAVVFAVLIVINTILMLVLPA